MLTHSGLLNRVLISLRLSFTRILLAAFCVFLFLIVKIAAKIVFQLKLQILFQPPKAKKLHSRRLLCSLLREKDGTNDYKPSKTTKTWQRTEKPVTGESVR